MRPSQARYITLCQQLLALAVVLAFLAPATNVISLDVSHAPEAAPTLPLAAEATSEAPVETAPVESTVEETPLEAETTPETTPETAPENDPEAGVESLPEAAPSAEAEPSVEATPEGDAAAEPATPATEVVGDPLPVTGYGAVGVTWSAATPVAGDEISFDVRYATAGAWSDWEELPYEALEDGSATDDPEAEDTRPGTELFFVGEVDEVQVRAEAPGGLPDDLLVAVIDPGESEVVEEAPAYQGGALPSSGATTEEPATGATPSSDAEEGSIALQAAATVPRPAIYSRAQWGADESMRDGAPRYAAVKGAVIHHTVNANNYTAEQVPGIIRGIYAYHTRSQGWSDVGYNFLVDRFGRLWEGRYGGVTAAVRGAHISAYNDYAFGISAIGNYDIAAPSNEMVASITRLIAWKLSIHGIDATSTQSWGGVRMPAIIGHRDGGSTACPGRYLYAKIPGIRTEAKKIQTTGGSTAPTPTPTPPAPENKATAPNLVNTNLMGSADPDLAFRMNDGRIWVLPGYGGHRYNAPVRISGNVAGAQGMAITPDLTGDGKPDFVVVDRAGKTWIAPGAGGGTFSTARVGSTSMFKGTDNLTPVGDIDGDGNNDLVARFTANGRTIAYLGTGRGTFNAVVLSANWSGYDMFTSVGDVTGDGRADLLMRDKAGKLWIVPLGVAGTLRGQKIGIGQRISVPGDFSGITAMGGWGDATGDAHADLVMRLSSGTLYVLPGNGAGRFGPARGPLGGNSLSNLSGAGNLIGTGAPDLVGRQGDYAYIVPHAGTLDHLPAVPTNLTLPDAAAIFNVGDWDKDGRGDLVVRAKDGNLTLYRGSNDGSFWSPTSLGTGFEGVSQLRFVGDVTNDGYGDFMGVDAGGTLRVYPGKGTAGFGPSLTATPALRKWFTFPGVSMAGYDIAVATASWTRGTRPDLVLRHKATGQLRLIQFNASGGIATNRIIAEASSRVDLMG